VSNPTQLKSAYTNITLLRDATQRQYDLVLAVSTAASAHKQEIQDRIQSQGELMESVSTRLDELVRHPNVLSSELY
jgi:hypothetical protein